MSAVIVIEGERRVYAPGEMLSGGVAWELNDAPEHAEVRLFWYTAGIGTRDVGLVETQVLEQPRASDEHRFAFVLPAEPYSFSGSLISVIWAVELVLEPGEETAREEFRLSPFEDEIVLTKIEEPKKKGGGLRARA